MNPAHKMMLMESLRMHGWCTVLVDGESMKPFIRAGDRIKVAALAGSIHPGMVVAFFDGERFFAHRVWAVDCKGGMATVTGDSSPGSRGMVSTGDIIGRVISAQRNGRIHRLFFHPPFDTLALMTGCLLRAMAGLKIRSR